MTGRGTVLGGRYELTERIGGGGMGSVWRADDQVLARQVAVKLLHSELYEDGTFAERFRREGQLMAALNHPGIVDVHDYGESGEEGADDRIAYIVMELIDGRPLNDVLAESGPMAPERALALLAQALDALNTAHNQDIVHRDLKPSNLMVRADDRVKVTDFGIARAMAATKITASHTVLGTALYMAPEQAEGKSTTPASDLYSIGVVCYELLTGQPPFSGETVLEVALKHIREPVPELPEVLSPAVRAFVSTALAKKPEDRYADAGVMAAAARAAIEGRMTTATAALLARAKEAQEVAKADTADAPVVRNRPDGEKPRRRTARRLLVPVIIPVIITTGAGTALLIERAPDQRAGAAPAPQQTVAASTPADGTTPPATGTPSATGTATAPATPTPTDSGAPTTPAGEQPASGVQPGQPLPPGTGGGVVGGQNTGHGTGSASGGAAGGSATGGASSSGGGSNPAPNQPAPPPAGGNNGGNNGGGGSQPAPTTPPKTAEPSVPQGCGGNGWGYITNVGSGLRLGLAQNNLSAGNKAVMGGATAYGWIREVNPGNWYYIHPCNLDAPALVQSATDGAVTLNPGFSFLNNWAVVGTGGGTHTLRDYQSQSCLTDNGAGNPVTMTKCTPGNKAQEFRLS
ncbi:protein kinase domain-containing protein [Kitasatospora sp. NPDC054939]